jgi:hypothetical protein
VLPYTIANIWKNELGRKMAVVGSKATIFTVYDVWIRIRKDPKRFAGSGSVTRGYESGSETELEN